MKPEILNTPIYRLVREYGFEQACKELNKTESEMKEALLEAACDIDFEMFAETRLMVEDTLSIGDKIVPFKLNNAQKMLLAEIEYQKSKNIPIRIAHLKPRQYGASTFFEGYIFKEVVFKRNMHATTISYQHSSSEHLRAIAERFYQWYPKAKPVDKGRSDKLWKFPTMDSTWRIESAENLQAGHSFTNQILHVSELSRWERDADIIMRGLTSSVPSTPDSMIIVESTAKGYGNYFHELWKLAKSGKSPYRSIFTPWYIIEKHTMPFFEGLAYDGKTKYEFEKSLFEYEKNLMSAYDVTLEQLHWRRWKIDGDLKGNEDSFFEQYPSNDEEAFLHSGRPYFPITLIREKLVETEKKEVKRGFLEWRINDDTQERYVVFEEDRQGWWKILEEPKIGWQNRYVTGSDPAEGIIVNEATQTPDNSVCVVLDRLEKKEVARLSAILFTEVFAEEIYKASKFYNSCCECVEKNSAGVAVIQSLKEKDINLYIRNLFGKKNEKQTEEYGFRTDTSTRDMLLSELRTRIRFGNYNSDDYDFWVECSTFVVENGKPIGQKGCKDDKVFSGGLVIQADLQAGLLYQIIEPEKVKIIPMDNDMYWQYQNRTAVTPFDNL